MTPGGTTRPARPSRYLRDVDDSELRSPFSRRLSRRRLIGLDAGAAAVCTLAPLLLSGETETSAALVVPLAAAVGLPLAVRRLWPVPVFAAVLSASTVTLLLGLPWDSFVGPAFALYVVALTRVRRRWMPTPLIGVVSGAVILGGAMAGPANRHGETAGRLLLGLAVLGASWSLGRVVRERRAETARSARQFADQAVSEERLRIARELHDVLGHNISLINVQATAALHGLRREPERAEDALTAIKQASKDTLREMRATLGVLRQVDEAAPVTPAPGLARLDELTDGIAAAGLTIRTEVEGEPRPLPAETDLAAYRIVQEALTNVARHSNATTAAVRISYAGADVTVHVDDDGDTAAAGPSQDGSGIRGMRDRAKALGGDFDAGPRPGGGFTVRARLPA